MNNNIFMFNTKTVNDDSDKVLESDVLHKQFHNFSKKLLCVEYPGAVNNIDRALETLGGLGSLEMAVGTKNKNVELRFRPDDIYCKPCYGDKEKQPGILIKVKVRRPKNAPNVSFKAYDYEVVGVTAMNVKFKRMCDFQYLPLITLEKKETPTSPVINIQKIIFPDKLPDISYLDSDATKNIPMFFPPSIFSRHSRSIEMQQKNTISDILEGTVRKSRQTYTIIVKFEDKNYPSGPPPQIRSLDDTVFMKDIQKIKEIFLERPIWSKIGLQHRLQIPYNKLKHLIVHVAFHVLNGPWRVMWIRYGCDPRKDPSMRIYQTFDYRLRLADGLKTKINAKNKYKIHGFRGNLTNVDKVSLRDQLFDENRTAFFPSERDYILRPGILPTARQILYQFCDIKLPKIQAMFKKLPEIPPDAECHPKNGWLPESFQNQCREIVNNYIAEAFQAMETSSKESKENLEEVMYYDAADEEIDMENKIYNDDSSEDENGIGNEDFQSGETVDEEEMQNINSFLATIMKDE